jgi:translation initiation factor 1 (eIF-1/SUI1)
MDLNNLLNNNFLNKPVNEIEINKIDIYLKQRTGRKYITEIFGINFSNEERLKTFAKDLRKKFSCCCSIEKNDNSTYLKLSSKDINSITNFILKTFNISKDKITIHGD